MKARGREHLEMKHTRRAIVVRLRVSLAERSKAPDSSSGGAIRVGSNPTAVTFLRGRIRRDVIAAKVLRRI